MYIYQYDIGIGWSGKKLVGWIKNWWSDRGFIDPKILKWATAAIYCVQFNCVVCVGIGWVVGRCLVGV